MIVEPFSDDASWQPPPSRAAPGWMITFADLLALLLAFFVLMFATMTVDEAQWRVLISPVMDPRLAIPPPVGTGEAVDTGSRPLEPAYVATLLQRLAAQDPGLVGAEVERNETIIRLVLPAAPAARWIGGEKPPLAGLAGLAAGLDLPVTITVAVPLARGGEAGAWEIALDGAGALGAELHRLGLTRPVTIAGGLRAGDEARASIAFEAPHDAH